MIRTSSILIGFLAAVGGWGVVELTTLRAKVSAQESRIDSFRLQNRSMSRRLAEANARIRDLLEKRLKETDSVWKRWEKKWRDLLGDLRSVSNRVAAQTNEIKTALTRETAELAESLEKAIGKERKAVLCVAERSSTNTRELELLKKRLERNTHRMKEWMIYPTVQLRGNGTVGSGVIVSSRPDDAGHPDKGATTLILTAYHVVLEVTKENSRDLVRDVRIMGEGGALLEKTYTAEVLTFDRSRDVALLKLNARERFPYVARIAPPREVDRIDVFEPAYAVGCPLGNVPIPTAGQITTKRKLVDNHNFWMINAPTYFGNSGGGIYLARDGRLIGISSMIYTYGRANPTVVPHLGLFVPINDIVPWLEREGFGFICPPDAEVPGHLAEGKRRRERTEGESREGGLRPVRFTAEDPPR